MTDAQLHHNSGHDPESKSSVGEQPWTAVHAYAESTRNRAWAGDCTYSCGEYRGGSSLRRQCVVNGVCLAPVPGHQLIELLDGMAGDTGKDVGQPGLGIDVVELGGNDEAVKDGGTVTSAIRTGEQPGFPAKGDAAQSSFGGIVGQADAAVVEEAGESGPALEHVIDGAGDVGVA